MTIQKIRDLIDAPTSLHDGKVFLVLPKDDNYRHSVMVIFGVSDSGEKIQITGCSPEMKIASTKIADALMFCNNYNKDKSFLSVYFDQADMDFNANYALLCSGVPDEALKNCFTLMAAIIWQYFVAVGKEF